MKASQIIIKTVLATARHFKDKADDQTLDDISNSSNDDSAHNLASSAFMKVYQMTIKNVKKRSTQTTCHRIE